MRNGFGWIKEDYWVSQEHADFHNGNIPNAILHDTET